MSLETLEENHMTNPTMPAEDKASASCALDELGLDREELRSAIREEYREVAEHPDKGFHFHTGRKLAELLEYTDDLLQGIPDASIESFAGTGNPFSLGDIEAGETVVDVGCGAGIDSLIAARLVGENGRVIGVDMTPQMLEKARRAQRETGLEQVEFVEGTAEALPVENESVDVIISNGVFNLTPDKPLTLNEWNRVLAPGGRIQIADILVDRPVPEGAKRDIDLWTG